jgi:hypothetical protein
MWSRHLQWNYLYTIKRGDTLSMIAQNTTIALHQAGAPSNAVVTFWQIYDHNQWVIVRMAKAHSKPILGGAVNNIFPGEKIWLPTWR